MLALPPKAQQVVLTGGAVGRREAVFLRRRASGPEKTGRRHLGIAGIWNLKVSQDFYAGVAARLGHGSVQLLRGRAGVADGPAQQLRVPAELGHVPRRGVALPQQLLRSQRYVQQTRLPQDFRGVVEPELASSGGAVSVRSSGFEDGGGGGTGRGALAYGPRGGTGGRRPIGRAGGCRSGPLTEAVSAIYFPPCDDGTREEPVDLASGRRQDHTSTGRTSVLHADAPLGALISVLDHVLVTSLVGQEGDR